MLHAVYRVGDMATTIDYYKKHFGMKLLRYRDIPDVRADLPLIQYKSGWKHASCSPRYVHFIFWTVLQPVSANASHVDIANQASW